MTRKAAVVEILEAPAPRRKPGPKPKVASGILLDTNLTPVQEAYCRARAMGMSPAEALGSIGAPCALSTVKTWEKKLAQVRDRIGELSAMATENAILKTGLSREWVITRLMSVADRCLQAEPVLDRKGQPTGLYEFDSAGANAALRLLGDTMGLYKHVERKPGEELAGLSDDTIEAIARELGIQTGLLPG